MTGPRSGGKPSPGADHAAPYAIVVDRRKLGPGRYLLTGRTGPGVLLAEVSAVKQRGSKAYLMMAGGSFFAVQPSIRGAEAFLKSYLEENIASLLALASETETP